MSTRSGRRWPPRSSSDRGGAAVADARPGERNRGVFCEGEAEPLGDGVGRWSGFASGGVGLMATITYLQAISARCATRCAPTSACCMMGEDIGVFGGAFKVTDGFIEEFGPDRVMDTPLAESAIIGCAVGAAVVGMRPVCEMQFSDFISCGFDQLVNVAGKMHYRQGLAVPITVRLPSGGGFSGGPFHSQNPEAWFMHAPGIKVVAPSTAARREGPASHRDPRPEPGLLHGAQAPVPENQGRGPRGHLRDADDRARGTRPAPTSS